MNFASVLVVLSASGAALASLVLRLVLSRAIPRLRAFAPATRVRWVLGLLGAPAISGVLAIGVAFGPCLRTLVMGMPDACRSHGGPVFFFCLRMPMPDMPVATALAAALALLVSWRLCAAARSIWRTRSALGQLRRLGRYDSTRGVWLVPGEMAVVAGWPRSETYVGESIARRFSSATLDAVLAHEEAHQRRHDLTIKLVAQALAVLLPASVRGPLLGELDLAMEQACDALAAEKVRDPFAVARSLIDLARAAAPVAVDHLVMSFVAPADHLEARVRALCEPSWSSSRWAAAVLIGIAAVTITACVVLDPSLHDVTEALFGHLLG